MMMISRMMMITARIPFLLQHLSSATIKPPAPSPSSPGVGLISLKTSALHIPSSISAEIGARRSACG
ncbi:MAG: hypothetical protein QOJ70_120 [Acidobacteriota bacterium]|nr:hypothetical protein [Acidobacteriota bacterium]